MPTNTEQIQTLRDLVVRMDEQIRQIQQRIDRADGLAEKSSNLLIELDKRLTLVESLVDGMRKADDDRRRQHWNLALAVIASILTLIVNIVLLILRK